MNDNTVLTVIIAWQLQYKQELKEALDANDMNRADICWQGLNVINRLLQSIDAAMASAKNTASNEGENPIENKEEETKNEGN